MAKTAQVPSSESLPLGSGATAVPPSPGSAGRSLSPVSSRFAISAPRGPCACGRLRWLQGGGRAVDGCQAPEQCVQGSRSLYWATGDRPFEGQLVRMRLPHKGGPRP